MITTCLYIHRIINVYKYNIYKYYTGQAILEFETELFVGLNQLDRKNSIQGSRVLEVLKIYLMQESVFNSCPLN